MYSQFGGSLRTDALRPKLLRRNRLRTLNKFSPWCPSSRLDSRNHKGFPALRSIRVEESLLVWLATVETFHPCAQQAKEFWTFVDRMGRALAKTFGTAPDEYYCDRRDSSFYHHIWRPEMQTRTNITVCQSFFSSFSTVKSGLHGLNLSHLCKLLFFRLREHVRFWPDNPSKFNFDRRVRHAIKLVLQPI